MMFFLGINKQKMSFSSGERRGDGLNVAGSFSTETGGMGGLLGPVGPGDDQIQLQ